MSLLPKILITIPLLAFCTILNSQTNTISNFRKTITSDHKLIINYSIPANNSATFIVQLKFTYNGELIYPDPSNLYGDYGENITTGEKILYWDFGNESIQDIDKVQVEISLIPNVQVHAMVVIGSLHNNGFAPSNVFFENHSTNANSYRWDFGDPSSGSQNISNELTPNHIFSNPGIYTVTLTAIDSRTGQESYFYKTVEIKSHESPVADFEVNTDNPKAPVRINFINLSLNAESFYWDFDDPPSGAENISLDRDPQHEYSHGGAYIVKLLVSNPRTGLIDTLHKELIIQNADIPISSFIFSKSSDFAPAAVSFENKSEFVDIYHWNFGDESSGYLNESSEESPVHLYKKPGNYIVTLKSRQKWFKRSIVYTDTIQIENSNKPVNAGFNIQNNSIYAPGTIIFKNTSSNATDFSWNFGDTASGTNNTSKEFNPTHTYYQPGNYKVVLIAGGNSDKEKSVFSKTVFLLKVPELKNK